VQEGDAPAENPAELIVEYERASTELTRLIQQINRTNSVTVLGPEGTISDAIAVRDVLKSKQNAYNALAAAATVTQDRYSRSEVKFQGTVDVTAIQRQADSLARDYRELDARIQASNWTTDLIEA
jgi:hypothetical protein